MSFVSPEFVLFFAVIVPLFFLTPQRGRWLLLLAASYFFYAYGNVQYLPLIVFSTLVDYLAARGLGRTERAGRRRLLLLSSIMVNLGVLFTFKYFNFFSESFAAISGQAPLTVTAVLPIGISFYTFQSMAYTFDVYRRKIAPEPHLGVMATYVAFFPQLVAGPIERAGHLLPQFHQHMRFDPARAVSGFQQILWGFFKKVVIADRLAIYVNAVYNDVESYSGPTLIVATLFFAFQIYCDFSGYSDIAIGTARVMGFDLMENFRQPYFAPSVREFWNRWHISLSTWFRDYVYIPLGGNRVSLRRNLLNLMVVFLVSGLWHGAGWTFVIWGALHGAYVVSDAWMRSRGWTWPSRAPRPLKVGVTFVLVGVAWVFFRANRLDDALYVFTHALTLDLSADLSAPFTGGLLGASAEFALSWGLIGLLLLMDAAMARRGGAAESLSAWHLIPRWAAYYAMGAAVMFSGLYGLGAQQFIYFQF